MTKIRNAYIILIVQDTRYKRLISYYIRIFILKCVIFIPLKQSRRIENSPAEDGITLPPFLRPHPPFFGTCDIPQQSDSVFK